MYFYAIYTANTERVFVHEQEFSTDEFHIMCEEAPKVLINGEEKYSITLITEWLMMVYNFCPVPYHSTFHAY